MEITGKLESKSPIQQVTDTFKKQEFVIEHAENPDYPQFSKFEAIQDKCGLIEKYSEGATVTVHFNLNGRKYESPEKGTMYFNTLQAWKITSDIAEHVADNEQAAASEEVVEDLPF